MSVPWDGTFPGKMEGFWFLLTARDTDGDPNLVYVPMGGLGQTGESRVAIDASETLLPF